MKKIVFFIAMTISLMAQQKGPAKAVAVKAAAPDIRAENQAEDPPEFRRRYFSNVISKPGITMTLDCKTDRIWEDRECTATLRQPDEKSVAFAVGGRYSAYDSIADKIIDPVIVPEVKRLAAEMHLQDAKYMQANPTEFKTKDGNRWAKVR